MTFVKQFNKYCKTNVKGPKRHQTCTSVSADAQSADRPHRAAERGGPEEQQAAR